MQYVCFKPLNCDLYGPEHMPPPPSRVLLCIHCSSLLVYRYAVLCYALYTINCDDAIIVIAIVSFGFIECFIC